MLGAEHAAFINGFAVGTATARRATVERIVAGLDARGVKRGNVYWVIRGLLDAEAARV